MKPDAFVSMRWQHRCRIRCRRRLDLASTWFKRSHEKDHDDESAVQGASAVILDSQTHDIDATVLGPVLEEFPVR
jgi:hypothetical protein